MGNGHLSGIIGLIVVFSEDNGGLEQSPWEEKSEKWIQKEEMEWEKQFLYCVC